MYVGGGESRRVWRKVELTLVGGEILIPSGHQVSWFYLLLVQSTTYYYMQHCARASVLVIVQRDPFYELQSCGNINHLAFD